MLPIHLDSSNHVRSLGHVPTDPTKRRAFAPPLGASEVIPESEWIPGDFGPSTWGLAVKDQGAYGACNGHAAASAVEWAFALTGFQDESRKSYAFSAWWVYAILCNGVDRGSNIGDALDLCASRGVCRDALVPHGTINPGRLSTAAKADALDYRIELSARPVNGVQVMSCLQRGEPVNLSVYVGSGFDRLDSDGVPAVYPTSPGNHAVMAIPGTYKRSSKWGPLFKVQNSWGAQWGQQGCFWLPFQALDRQPWFEAYSVRAVQIGESRPHRPPLVP